MSRKACVQLRRVAVSWLGPMSHSISPSVVDTTSHPLSSGARGKTFKFGELHLIVPGHKTPPLHNSTLSQT